MLKVRVLAHTPEPEKIVANAARLCYSSMDIDGLFEKYTDEENEGMIGRLMDVKHFSPVEHISFTFGIEGISRSLSHQLVRHRLASFSQQSQRYVKEDQFEYITPEAISRNPYANRSYNGLMRWIQAEYDYLTGLIIFDEVLYHHEYIVIEIERKMADILGLNYGTLKVGEFIPSDRDNVSLFIDMLKESYIDIYKKYEKQAIEDARYVLPNATETKIVFTMNARTLLNFFKLRCCRRAQAEIVELADKMLIECKKIAPTVFKYAGASCMYGKCPEGTLTCGKKRKPEEYEEMILNE